MRQKERYRGDLSRFVDQAINETDLAKVSLIEVAPAREHQLIVSVRPEMDRKLRRAAAKRGCDIGQLGNSALADWLARNPKEIRKSQLPCGPD
jgi:hypothetical protein